MAVIASNNFKYSFRLSNHNSLLFLLAVFSVTALHVLLTNLDFSRTSVLNTSKMNHKTAELIQSDPPCVRQASSWVEENKDDKKRQQ